MEASKPNVSLEPCEGGTETRLKRKRHWKHGGTSGKAWAHLSSGETLAEAVLTNKHAGPAKNTWYLNPPPKKKIWNIQFIMLKKKMVTFLYICVWRFQLVPLPTAEFEYLDWIYMDTLCSHREATARRVTLNSAPTYAIFSSSWNWSVLTVREYLGLFLFFSFLSWHTSTQDIGEGILTTNSIWFPLTRFLF